MNIFEDIKNHFKQDKVRELKKLDRKEWLLSIKKDNIVHNIGTGNNVAKYFASLAVAGGILGALAAFEISGQLGAAPGLRCSGSLLTAVAVESSALILEEILQRKNKVQKWSLNNYQKRIEKIDSELESIKSCKESLKLQ